MPLILLILLYRGVEMKGGEYEVMLLSGKAGKESNLQRRIEDVIAISLAKP